jgi:Fe-S protein assembly co-chaperone HscB
MNQKIDYFQLLEIDRRYDINMDLLEQQYLIKQNLYHPDKAQDSDIKGEYLKKSAWINVAYQCLKNDYQRAEHLLNILGKSIDSQVVLSKSELSDIFESYEIIDAMEKLSDLIDFQTKKMLEKNFIVQKLVEYFKSEDLIKALKLTVFLKYLTNLLSNLKLKIHHASS